MAQTSSEDPGVIEVLRDAVARVVSSLGAGLPVEIQADAVAVALDGAGVPFERDVEVRVSYEGRVLPTPLRVPLLLQGRLPVLLRAGSTHDDAEVRLRRILEQGEWESGALITLEASDAARRVVQVGRTGAAPKRARRHSDARKGAERLTGQPPRE